MKAFAEKIFDKYWIDMTVVAKIKKPRKEK